MLVSFSPPHNECKVPVSMPSAISPCREPPARLQCSPGTTAPTRILRVFSLFFFFHHPSRLSPYNDLPLLPPSLLPSRPSSLCRRHSKNTFFFFVAAASPTRQSVLSVRMYQPHRPVRRQCSLFGGRNNRPLPQPLPPSTGQRHAMQSGPARPSPLAYNHT